MRRTPRSPCNHARWKDAVTAWVETLRVLRFAKPDLAVAHFAVDGASFTDALRTEITVPALPIPLFRSGAKALDTRALRRRAPCHRVDLRAMGDHRPAGNSSTWR